MSGSDELSEVFARLQEPYPPMGSPEEAERMARGVKAEEELNKMLEELS